MIYVVSQSQELFADACERISVEESIKLLEPYNKIQLDTETTGIDSRIDSILTLQLGTKDFQIVIDATTIPLRKYKELIEKKFIVGHNLKFDLQFLFSIGIIPTSVYDTMIVEQLLHLGYPVGTISFSLQAVAQRRLDVYIDKSVRGQIIWRGIDTETIVYGATDVKYLEDIMESQWKDVIKQDMCKGAKLECQFVPVIAYLEWCGIYLNEEKWKAKMEQDKEKLNLYKKELDDYVIKNEKLKEFTYVNTQGDLFTGFDLTPKCSVNWDSPLQMVKLFKVLGFNTKTSDKKTGKDKDSVLEKVLKGQKGIDDNFLSIYFNYKEFSKVCSTYGQGHLDAINPKTGRIHTVYRQLGTASGRMSCGSNKGNKSLAALKKLPESRCIQPNIQQLPGNKETRSCFTAQRDDYIICSCDFSALESRLGADIYQESAMLNEYLHGSGDIHSLVAKKCFPKELEGIEVKDIAEVRPDLRKKAKGPEFAMQFGGSPKAIQSSLGCSKEEAEEIASSYWKGFPNIAKFKAMGSRFVKEHGYVLMCKHTGHKMYWYGHKEWVNTEKTFTPEFWREYKAFHKGTGDLTELMVKEHSKIGSYWERMALNSVTQGTGAVILKYAMVLFFRWILDNNLFGIVYLSALVHDESVIEYPKNMPEVAEKLKECMEESAATYCKSLPIPAKPEIEKYWKH